MCQLLSSLPILYRGASTFCSLSYRQALKLDVSQSCLVIFLWRLGSQVSSIENVDVRSVLKNHYFVNGSGNNIFVHCAQESWAQETSHRKNWGLVNVMLAMFRIVCIVCYHNHIYVNTMNFIQENPKKHLNSCNWSGRVLATVM